MVMQSGTRIGDYEIGGVLGRGGVGTVHRARHLGSGRQVAVKEVAGGTDAVRREAGLLARSDHPNVVRVVEVVADGGRTVLVQELVDGPSLADVLAVHGPLTGEQALGVLRGAVTGLAHVHALGLVHGDPSPHNVLFDHEGTAKLLDFGSALPVGEGGRSSTPVVASPEAVLGAPLLPASDVYSATALLHLLLTGRPVFPRVDVAGMLRAHLVDPPPALTGHGPHLAALVARGLAKDPTDRPVDAAALLAELEDAATRTHGAGWAGRSGMAAVVAGTTAAIAVPAAAPLAGAGAGTVVVGGTAAARAAAGAGWRGGRALVAAGVGAVVAVGALLLVLTAGDDEPEVRSAADDQALATSRAAASSSAAAASSAAATSAAQASLESSLPDGVYEVTISTVASDIAVFPAGGRTSLTWTLASQCTATACTTTLESSAGVTYTGTFDGDRLIAGGGGYAFCTDESGQAIDGTTSEVATVTFELALDASGQQPVLTGQGLRTITVLPGPQTADCVADAGYAVGQTATSEYRLTWSGAAPAPVTD